MSPHEHSQVEELVAALRRAIKADPDAAAVSITGAQGKALADELSRLLQSSERLRRQNGKLRRRIERLKGGLPDLAPDLADDIE